MKIEEILIRPELEEVIFPSKEYAEAATQLVKKITKKEPQFRYKHQ